MREGQTRIHLHRHNLGHLVIGSVTLRDSLIASHALIPMSMRLLSASPPCVRAGSGLPTRPNTNGHPRGVAVSHDPLSECREPAGARTLHPDLTSVPDEAHGAVHVAWLR